VRADAAGGQTHFTGLTHLASQPVAVLANGGVVPGLSVAADGSLDLPGTSVPATPYTLIVGLAYTMTVVTLRPSVQVNGQSAQGVRQRLVKVVVRLLETLGLKAGDPSNDILEELIDRPASAPMDAPIPLFTGDTPGEIDGTFDRKGQAVFVSSDPLPATIPMAMLNIDVDTRDV